MRTTSFFVLVLSTALVTSTASAQSGRAQSGRAESGRAESGRALASPVESAPPATSEAPAPELRTRELQAPDLTVPPPPGASYGGADDVERAVEGPISTRLRALDGNLRSLAARGGPNVFGPILSILSGAGSFTLGAFVQEPLNYFLYTFGVASAARGVLELALAPNASDDAVTFQNMPMTTREEVLARLRYGESALEGLAERAAILRYTTGGLNVAGGLAVIPAYLAPNDWELTSGLDAFVLIGAGVSVISGVITLLSTSAEEQRWQAYERLRDRLEDADVQAAVPQAPAPRVSAGLGQLTVQF